MHWRRDTQGHSSKHVLASHFPPLSLDFLTCKVGILKPICWEDLKGSDSWEMLDQGAWLLLLSAYWGYKALGSATCP